MRDRKGRVRGSATKLLFLVDAPTYPHCGRGATVCRGDIRRVNAPRMTSDGAVTNMSMAAIIVGFIVSTIGFSLFLYGRKQKRVPQLVLGVVLMALPFVAPSPVWTACISAALLVGLWFGLRSGW